MDIAMITADAAMKNQHKLNNITLNYNDHAMMGNDGIMIQQVIGKNANSQKNINIQHRAATSNAMYPNQPNPLHSSPRDI
jgi:hypothetical protein